MKQPKLSAHVALGAWAGRPEASNDHGGLRVPERHDIGLINHTFMVGQPPMSVLQWVNPIFDPSIQLDIQAMTERLAARGWTTPRLLETDDGTLWAGDDDGFWRLMTYVDGHAFSRLESPAQAEAAGRLVGRFHAEMIAWSPTFISQSRRLPDTREHMARLEDLELPATHRRSEDLRRLREQILVSWSDWTDSHAQHRDLPERPCHGDLKISNLLFDESGEGLCLIDLDTLAYRPLAREMGDAWRSWCNPSGEDAPEPCRLDLDLFEASARGWLEETNEVALDDREIESLVPGLERIALELAARFACDILEPSYFREDRESFQSLGEHNLQRARCQLQLARSAREHRERCQQLIHNLRRDLE